ncbi:MAG: redoxin domain-containing protein [Phycisphaerales bacterium]|nr:redoxin domain-containing protein [Planctomycetota bacterium]MCH8509816.1 redoxin domain-containing protein [Phycisphaerales bacterium]
MPPTATMPERQAPPNSGDQAPDFTLLDQDRQEWTLSEALKSGPVVLCFFPLAFTSVCSEEMGCVSRDFDRWSKQGMQVVGVSCDSFATLKAWADQTGYKHRLLADMHRAVCKGYGLYWADLNVAHRGTVIVEQGPGGSPVVRWAEAREPGQAMNFDAVLTAAAG